MGSGSPVAHARTLGTTPTSAPLLRRRAAPPRLSFLRWLRDHGRSSREADQDQDRSGEAVRNGRRLGGLLLLFSPHRRGSRRSVGPMRARLPGLGGRDARGRTRLGWRWQGAALGAGPAALHAGLRTTSALAPPPFVRARSRPLRPWAGRRRAACA